MNDLPLTAITSISQSISAYFLHQDLLVATMFLEQNISCATEDSMFKLRL